ncbi:MAG: protein-L-isoaspartate(D-aspartate) O-methyltransferase [Candidatus Omnitrophota bacterium]
MNFSLLRKQMVEQQLLSRGINERDIIKAFETIPRHKFVPGKYVGRAYADEPVPIGNGQTISQPYIAALMTQCLAPAKNAVILEIGTGSGYQTAVLAMLAARVYTVERVAALAKAASARLEELGCHNVALKADDGNPGWPEYAPFDGIMVTAACSAIPQPLIEQLKVGGKLIVPVGRKFSQVLTEVIRHKNRIEIKQVCGCVFVPLIGNYGWPLEND